MASKVVDGVRWTQTARGNFPNVNVSVNSACAAQGCWSRYWTYGEWTMMLQRRGANGWNTIGTRTGYVSEDSPSHRTFTNVKKQGAIRVVTMIKESAYHRAITLIDHVD